MMQRLVIIVSVILIMSCVTHQEPSNGTGICHLYGDPHVIRFPQQPTTSQDQYWCKISNRHHILRNEYVEIVTNINDGTWLIDQFTITFFENNETLCRITNDEQYCESSKIRITRPSLTQIEIYYAIPQLYVSIVPHQYQYEWFDISIRMPYELIDRSSGLCVNPSVDNCLIENSIAQGSSINPLYRSLCEIYLMVTDVARTKLDLSNDPEKRNHALIACIYDYETTGNRNVGASLVNMIIKDRIYRQQSGDFEYQSKTIESIDIIDNAVANASRYIDILLGTTTQVPLTETTSQMPSIGTTTQGEIVSATNTITSVSSMVTSMRTTTTTTTSGCSMLVKSMYNVLLFPVCALGIQLYLSF